VMRQNRVNFVLTTPLSPERRARHCFSRRRCRPRF
jgi:hypothetical protein